MIGPRESLFAHRRRQEEATGTWGATIKVVEQYRMRSGDLMVVVAALAGTPESEVVAFADASAVTAGWPTDHRQRIGILTGRGRVEVSFKYPNPNPATRVATGE